MNKREYERLLCEVLVGCLIKGPDTSREDNLEEVLLTPHPNRESTFVEWAMKGIASNLPSHASGTHDITLVGDYL